MRHTGDLAALPAIADGRATPQDQASQAVVAVLDPQPGERVLDLASAPGGKATAAAERMRGDGLVVAADLHPGRVRTVVRGRGRIGRAADGRRPIVADGRHPPVRDGAFDRVLLDAPCSGLGVLRRRPDARWRVQPTDVRDLAALQRDAARGRRATRSGPAAGSCTRCARCRRTRRSTSTRGRAPSCPSFVAEPPPARAVAAATVAARSSLPSDAHTDGMFVLEPRPAAAA